MEIRTGIHQNRELMMAIDRTRRELTKYLSLAGVIGLGAKIGVLQFSPFARAATPLGRKGATAEGIVKEVEKFLDDMEKTGCLFFWEQASPFTGLVKDRSRTSKFDDHNVASIAATGFGLTALCIADKRGYLPSKSVETRVAATLQFLLTKLQHARGFFFHFIDVNSGERMWSSEISSIDTSLLLCGILTCRQHFSSPEIRNLATQIYNRTDWQWMLNGGKLLSHGWKPEIGFLPYRWDAYCELMMIYLLAIGSPTYPISPDSWDAWSRPMFEYNGLRYINAQTPLFVHQYSHAWFDFRGKRDRYANYFENSVLATKAHREFCASLHDRFADYSENLWGITASDSAKGYVVWGGPPEMGPIDGTLVPSAPAGSLPFLPQECMDALLSMRERFGKHVWKRYGFVDAFNPLKKWYAADVIGINTGIGLLMAENFRSNFVWDTFMKNAEARTAMERVGFKPDDHSTEFRSSPKPSPVA